LFAGAGCGLLEDDAGSNAKQVAVQSGSAGSNGFGGQGSAAGPGGAGAASPAGASAGGGGSAAGRPAPVCGDGVVDGATEACDDGNIAPGDGCSTTCTVEAGWSCASAAGSPSTCVATHPSCGGPAPLTCGGSDPDCCGSSTIPGGAFQRDSVADPLYAATVSDFRLDTYEVTVGRFAAFVADYPNSKPAPRSGRDPNDYVDPGWDPAWDAYLPADQAALTADVQCEPTYQTWGRGDTLAMNCVTWYEAFAFCIWDGGRLPTSAEWNYAAAGGTEERTYPWSSPPANDHIDASYAVFAPAEQVAPVGSKSPKGDGKYGQSDLGGNVWEWLQDWYAPYASTCMDCADLVPSVDRALRGGSFYDDASYLVTSTIDAYDPTYRVDYIGFRCARTPAAGKPAAPP
jgi:cysteine-rich repeat protein